MIRIPEAVDADLTPRTAVLLAAILSAGERGRSRGELSRQLFPYFQHRRSRGEWQELLESELRAAAAAGWLRSPRSVRSRIFLSEAGVGAIRSTLALGAGHSGTTWGGLVSGALLALALQLRPPSPAEERRLRSADGLRAAILNGTERLGLEPYPTLPAVRSSLGWIELAKALGRPAPEATCRARFRDSKALAYLLTSRLGDSRPRTVDAILRLLAARAVHASRVDASDLRRAIIRRWLEADRHEADRHEAEPTAHAPSESTLAEFARAVQEAARACSPWKPGATKVFIADVWREYCARSAGRDMTEAQFKERLVEANHRRLLDLARADLVGAMSPDRVRESEADYLGAAFHFVRLD